MALGVQSLSDLSERAEVLEDENEELRDSTRCKMCQSRSVNILFLPCGHLVACSQVRKDCIGEQGNSVNIGTD